MKLTLSPFPTFFHPPAGEHTELPVTRDGVHGLPADALVASERNVFADLNMIELRTGAMLDGVCGLVPASAFMDGTIRPHEKTLSPRLQRQETLVAADRGALGKPVLLTTRDDTALWTQLGPLTRNTPDVYFLGRNTHYYLSKISSATGAGLDLDLLSPLVIADGHHRAATHARLAAEGLTTCALVPVCIVDIRGLHINIFGRRLAGYDASPEELLASLAPYFTVTDVPAAKAPTEDGDWLLTYRNEHYALKWHQVPAGYTTAAGWLMDTVLRGAFGITNVTNDARLEHIPVDVNTDTGLLLLDNTESLTICGSPITREQFFAEVEAGRTLPPKSTRFSPRIPSGLLVWKGC